MQALRRAAEKASNHNINRMEGFSPALEGHPACVWSQREEEHTRMNPRNA